MLVVVETCACGEDILQCPTCGNAACRDYQCAEGPAPCSHQLDEDARERAIELQIMTLRGK